MAAVTRDCDHAGMAKRRAKQRTEDEQRREVEGWRASGQSGEAYAKGRGYSHSSLTNWAAKFRRPAKAGGLQLVRLEVEKRLDLVVEVGGARILVGARFDAALLRSVVAALTSEKR
jgi:hypothetical protein